MKRVSFLESRDQINWMIGCGIIKDVIVTQENVLIRYSDQCPNGYEICRIECTIIEPDSDWTKSYLIPRFRPAEKYIDIYRNEAICPGFHNEFKELPDSELEKVIPFESKQNGCRHINIDFQYGTQPFVTCLDCNCLARLYLNYRDLTRTTVIFKVGEWNDKEMQRI
jgi:hypothetical protein